MKYILLYIAEKENKYDFAYLVELSLRCNVIEMKIDLIELNREYDMFRNQSLAIGYLSFCIKKNNMHICIECSEQLTIRLSARVI